MSALINDLLKRIESEVTEIIYGIGIPANIKGFHYLRAAILLSVRQSDAAHVSVMKAIYPDVANKFFTTPACVERAIRHAIGAAWGRGTGDELNSQVGFAVRKSREPPTNSELIALVADVIKRKYDLNE